jgi:hypothetical protein
MAHGSGADPGRRAADGLADRVGVSYRIRALVDRPMRSDLAVERAIAIL